MMFDLTGNPLSTPPIDINPWSSVTGRGGMTFSRRVIVTSLAAATNLWLIRVEVSWTEDGAAAGANGGLLDHKVSVEVIRTVEEAL